MPEGRNQDPYGYRKRTDEAVKRGLRRAKGESTLPEPDYTGLNAEQIIREATTHNAAEGSKSAQMLQETDPEKYGDPNPNQ